MKKINIRVIMILIIIGGFIKPYYTFLTNEIDNNLASIIKKEENLLKKQGYKLTNELIINQCISKEEIKETGFISIKDKNKNKEIKSNKTSLKFFTKNECKKYYSNIKENKELKNQYFNLLASLVLFYLVLGFTTKKWL